MINYKEKVLEYYGATFTDDYNEQVNKEVQYIVLNTADSYNIYQRYTGESYILWDEDMYYYAESCVDNIWDDIKDGRTIFVDSEISDECGFAEDAWQWSDEYEKLQELAE
jgi:hypothetical protein